MSEQHPDFLHTLLEYRLQERLDAAIGTINNLSQEEVLRCDYPCLTEIVRQFAVDPPILRSDRKYADKRIGESEDILSGRRTGHTLHSFFIPVEREAKWLEDVGSQTVKSGCVPLAFLDKERARIEIRLVVAPEDEEGALERNVEQRTNLVEQYTASVTEKLVEFNKTLAKEMANALNIREKAITKAEKELATTALPRKDNPAHAETALKIERVLRGLGAHMSTMIPRHTPDRRGAPRPYYICNSYCDRDTRCSAARHYNAEKLEAEVASKLDRWFSDP